MPALFRPLAVLSLPRTTTLLLLLTAAAAAHAQPVSLPLSYRALSAEARAVAADTLPALRTRAVAGGRVDAVTGVARADYRLALPPAPGRTPEAAARVALAGLADRFGWDPAAPDLETLAVRDGRYSAHVTFRQTVRGVPVYGRTVKLSLDRDGRPTMVLSGYDPRLADAPLVLTATISAAAAAVRSERAVASGAVDTTPAELVVVPGEEGDPARLAWRIVARPEAVPAEWEVLVDAHTGELVALLHLATHAHTPSAAPAAPDWTSVTANHFARTAAPAARAVADGSGLVFDPDPLTTSGHPYAPPYTDQGDADVAALNDERRAVVLRGLTQGSDGRYRLEGPYVEVTGDRAIGGSAYVPPAEHAPDAFRYTRANPFFEAVMVYHHIDANQRYLQSLDVGLSVQEAPIRVNPHGLGTEDNARFYSWSNTLAFGRGGIDDAEDADVILHEYGHALLESNAPGLLGTSEGQALHEGWSDYWAASYSRLLEETGAVPVRAGEDWRKLYTWDGNDTWCGRTVDHGGRYPDDMAHPAPAGCWSDPLYEHGLLWATTLMEIYDVVGRGVSDRLNLASHAYLDRYAGFVDAAHALVKADFDLYGGAHIEVLVDVLSRRGFLPPDAYDVPLSHQPLASVDKTGGDVVVDVQTSMNVVIEAVRVRYRVGDGAEAEVALDRTGDHRFSGRLPLPDHLAVVTYYIEGEDAEGRILRLPANGTYRFLAGTDAAPPAVAHAPAAYASVVQWPLAIAVEAADNLGVEAVWVRYGVAPAGGADPVLMDSLALAPQEGGYGGVLDVPVGYFRAGDALFYTIHARDVAGNLAAVGVFEVPFRLGQRTDALADARPNGGWSPWGDGWSVDAAPGAYATLVLEPFLVPRNADEAVFVLTHAARLSGGGNVKVSTDAGGRWEVITPDEGYGATFDGSHPMGGEPVFRTADGAATFDLRPWAGRTVRLRLDAGATAAAPGEGWAVEAADFRVTTSADAFDVPDEIVLHANFPDPFAGATTLSYTLPRGGTVELAVYDLLGRRVAVLEAGEQTAGTHTRTFDAGRLASGLYFVRLQADGAQHVERMTVVR